MIEQQSYDMVDAPLLPCPAPPLFTDARPVVTDVGRAAALFGKLRNAAIERAAVLYLDPERRLLGRADFIGTATMVMPSFRSIFAEALRLDAAAIVLAHNHPGGDSCASAEDIAFTRALVRTAAALDIVVIDHLILTVDDVTSLRAAGTL